MIVKDLTHRDCLYVAEKMREADRHEIFATKFHDSPLSLAWECINSSASFGWTIGKDVPICAIGAHVLWPGVWSVWMFATDRFPEVGLFTTRFVKKRIIKALLPIAHRAQCYSVADHVEAHKWLVKLGASKEAVIQNYGKNAETFYLFSWSQYVL